MLNGKYLDRLTIAAGAYHLAIGDKIIADMDNHQLRYFEVLCRCLAYKMRRPAYAGVALAIQHTLNRRLAIGRVHDCTDVGVLQ